MKNGLVSVVLPIYNVHRYLDRCMESIINQSYSNIEIIMIDDGSTDECPEMCEKWAQRDSRIKVVHKHNAGLGMARNTGIECASGEFIVFFDSDDYVDTKTIEECYNRAIADNSDVVLFGHAHVNNDGTIAHRLIPHGDKALYSENEVVEIVLKNLLMLGKDNGTVRNFWMSAWSCFLSLELIKRIDWKFISEREVISEDIYSLISLYSYIKRVSIIEKSFYYYCENDFSLTHAFREDRFEKNNHFFEVTLERAKECGYDKRIIDCVAYPYLANIIAIFKQVVFSEFSILEKIKRFRIMLHNDTLQKALGSLDDSNEKITRRVLFSLMEMKKSLLVMILIRLNGADRNAR